MHHERPILVEVGNDRPLAGPASPEGQEVLHAKVAALLANSPLRDALLDEVLESIREEGLPGEAGPASPIVAAGAHPAAAGRSAAAAASVAPLASVVALQSRTGAVYCVRRARGGQQQWRLRCARRGASSCLRQCPCQRYSERH